jgi:hypothetical protein
MSASARAAASAIALQLGDRLVYIVLFIAISLLTATSAGISASLPGRSPSPLTGYAREGHGVS